MQTLMPNPYHFSHFKDLKHLALHVTIFLLHRDNHVYNLI